MLQNKTLRQEDLLSSSSELPFVGKYHYILRKRKRDSTDQETSKKKEYKKKVIKEKKELLIQKLWTIEAPLPHYHVYNFHNILAINEHALLNPECEESFVSSKFYMKKISKVTIRQACLLLHLQNVNKEYAPIPYLCQKLKSMGDTEYLRIAEDLESLEAILPQLDRKMTGQITQEQQKLTSFLQEMNNVPFFSQYSPHMLIISNSFLQIIGYDIEELAIQSIKYKSILNEFFSAQHYTRVIHKHLQNLQTLKAYFEGKMTLEQLCNQSHIVCQDYIYTRNKKKLRCHYLGGTSKQLRPYIKIRLPQGKSNSKPCITKSCEPDQFEEQKLKYKQKEFNLLRRLIGLPKHLDPEFKNKTCSYKQLNQDAKSKDES